MTSLDHAGSRVPAPPTMNGSAATQPTPAPVPSPPVVVREASAPRRWTGKGVAAAVMFVVIGGLILMVAIPAFSHRITVLVIARSVPVGSVITDADLTTATITSDPALRPILGSRRSAVIGEIAQTTLNPGSLLTTRDVGASDGFTAGQVLVALGCKQGQFPVRGLAAGERVLIVATPGASAQSDTNTSSAGAPATVAEVGPVDPATGITVIDVRVPAASGVAVAQLASTGTAALILLPIGG